MALDPALTAQLRLGELTIGGRVELWRLNGTKLVEFEAASITTRRARGGAGSCAVSGPGFETLVASEEVIGTDRRFGDGLMGDGLFGDYTRRVLRGVLTSANTEARLFWSAELPDGQIFELGRGRYVIDHIEWDDQGPEPTVSFTGFDIRLSIQEARWTRPFVIPPGTYSTDQVFNLVVEDRAPGTVVVHEDAAPGLSGRILLGLDGASSDPWKDLEAIARAAGKEVLVGDDGEIRTRAVPEGEGVPVWVLNDGEDGVNLAVRSSTSGQDIRNGVQCRVENAGEEPILVTVWDTVGPYAREAIGFERPAFMSAPGITTQVQAQNAAIAHLRRIGGVVETVVVTCAYAPHLRPGDWVRVRNSQLEIDAVFIVEVADGGDSAGVPLTITATRRIQ